MPELPKVVLWSDAKRAELRARWRWLLKNKRLSNGERYFTDEESGVAWFRKLFEYLRKSDFLMGRTSKPWNGLHLGWIVKQENFAKILGGNYENAKQEDA